MNAHRVETILTEDGVLVLQHLPFHAGDAVYVIVMERTQTHQDKIINQKSEPNLYPLQGKQPYCYDELLEPADREYLMEISSMMSEWESEADECAYSDPILFEVYKFVAREQSPSVARKVLSVIKQETVIILLEIETMQTIFDLAMQMTNWQGSLEDASVVVIAQKFNAPIWTIDYRDLSWFKNIQLWTW